MSIVRLVSREILHRKLGFVLGLLSVTIAAACLSAAMTLLRAHDLRTEEVIGAKEAETREQMAIMEDDYRKMMKKLGFNVLILPKDQNLADLYADDYASKTMPEEYVARLSQSRIVTIQHLLPILQEKIKWPERERTILLVGTRGEVPIMHADPKKPILNSVDPGQIVLGYELHKSLGLEKGSQLELLGRTFTVSETYGERGNKDDITAWINLGEAQGLLGKEGRINGILALECVCAADSLAKIRAEIAGILPDTQVIEFASQVLARAEARQRAAQTAKDALAAEKVQRARLRQEREDFSAVLVPLVMAGSGIWIGFLTLGNVRERRSEIGILRAIGLRSGQILSIFLSKAAIIGVIGGVVGWLIGFGIGSLLDHGLQPGQLFDVATLFLCAAAAPILAIVASWIPATLAARQQPAEVLGEE